MAIQARLGGPISSALAMVGFWGELEVHDFAFEMGLGVVG